MSLLAKLKRAARGEVKPTTATLEVFRRSRASLASLRELRSLNVVSNRAARLHGRYGNLDRTELLAHFRQRDKPKFFAGFNPSIGALQKRLFPEETSRLIEKANRIRDHHCWSLLGYEEQCFGQKIEWRRDPLSGFVSPLVYHRNLQIIRNDGSDPRVLWELNRLGHLIMLGRAFVVTKDETYSTEFFDQIKSWREQNPFGQGPNWQCAMEVALRAMNLIAAFEIFRHSSQLTGESLSELLAMFDQHGTYIRQNLEFSYIATSNHYLSDVVGLLWLGIMLPELSEANNWRQFGLLQMLSEVDKQILEDGADFESSTGYHRFVLELLFYSFLLCRLNGLKFPDQYWLKLRAMFEYVRSYIRPDGFAPLIGDTDSGQVMPIQRRAANDHGYLLPLGAVAFNDFSLKLKGFPGQEELLWLFGETGISDYESLPEWNSKLTSVSFADAGLHFLRHDDLYLSLNTTGAGINGRGSHGHNDALSIEVSACGRSFVVDPGTYVYTGDPDSRHEFRSTAYHSTVQINGVEQNTINIETPFIIGDEAKPRLLSWETNTDEEIVSAEHRGYERLSNPLTHRRTIIFKKNHRCWLIEDELIGNGEYKAQIKFHFDAGLEVTANDDHVVAQDTESGVKLLIVALTLKSKAELEKQFTSIDYGQRRESVSACWTMTGNPTTLRWLVVPVCAGENAEERLQRCAIGCGSV